MDELKQYRNLAGYLAAGALVGLILAALLAGCLPPYPTPMPDPSTEAEPARTDPGQPAALPYLVFRQVTPTPTPPVLKCIVTTGLQDGQLFLRDGPARDTRILAILTEGTTLELLVKPGGRWLRVQHGDLTGWVYYQYCEVIQ